MQKVLEGDVDKRLIVSRTKTDTVFTVECDSWRVNKTTALFIKSPSLLRGESWMSLGTKEMGTLLKGGFTRPLKQQLAVLCLAGRQTLQMVCFFKTRKNP